MKDFKSFFLFYHYFLVKFALIFNPMLMVPNQAHFRLWFSPIFIVTSGGSKFQLNLVLLIAKLYNYYLLMFASWQEPLMTV